MARQHVARLFTFGTALVLPSAAWAGLHEPTGKPLDWGALAAATVASLIIIPAVLLVLALSVHMPPSAFVPRRWRKRYRRWRKQTGVSWLQADREHQHSSYIADWLHALVHAADRHRCVACGSHRYLQTDHVYPWSQGGLTIFFNLMTLCRDCNVRIKNNYWPGVYYLGSANLDDAAYVLHREFWHRRNPLRLTRAAWALGA
jgi:5-methylcytosine-specific restriction endonuclease McrA